MHNQLRAYVEQHVSELTGRVLEVGSLDVNGSVRDLFPDRLGVDMQPGPGVDFICKAEDLPRFFKEGEFDHVVSIDALEHMEDWRGCVRGIWHCAKEGGWLLITIASPRKGFHGYPSDYWRMSWELVNQVFPKATNMENLGVSMGWMVKKEGSLPDLEKIELMKVR